MTMPWQECFVSTFCLLLPAQPHVSHPGDDLLGHWMSWFVFILLKAATSNKYPFFAFHSCFFRHPPSVCVCLLKCATVCACRSEVYFQKSILFFWLYAGDGVQLVRFGGEHFTCSATWPAPVLVLFFFVSYFCFVLFELQPHYIAWADLDLAILLPQSPKG